MRLGVGEGESGACGARGEQGEWRRQPSHGREGGLGQARRGGLTPAASEDVPLVADLKVIPDLFDVADEVLSGIVDQGGGRGRLAAAALVEQHDSVHRRVEPLSVLQASNRDRRSAILSSGGTICGGVPRVCRPPGGTSARPAVSVQLACSSHPPPGPPCKWTTGVPSGLPYCLMLSLWTSDTAKNSDLNGCVSGAGAGAETGAEVSMWGGEASPIAHNDSQAWPTLMGGKSWV